MLRGDDYRDREQLMERLAASDLIISRSGALTVAEVTVCGVPAIFIPFPEAAENHQYYNALAVAEKGGAIVIEEKDLDDDPLAKRIESIRDDQPLHKKSEGR